MMLQNDFFSLFHMGRGVVGWWGGETPRFTPRWRLIHSMSPAHTLHLPRSPTTSGVVCTSPVMVRAARTSWNDAPGAVRHSPHGQRTSERSLSRDSSLQEHLLRRTRRRPPPPPRLRPVAINAQKASKGSGLLPFSPMRRSDIRVFKVPVLSLFTALPRNISHPHLLRTYMSHLPGVCDPPSVPAFAAPPYHPPSHIQDPPIRPPHAEQPCEPPI